MHQRQLTRQPQGHILTNVGVWSRDGGWIVYDVRSDPAGSVFDGTRIERVSAHTGDVEILYESQDGACCGVATCSPADDRVVFIHGPERPTPNWQYAPYHRRGVIVDASRPGAGRNLDARDVTPPFTPGALRGGSHVHVFSGDGQWVSFTYEDHVLAELHAQRPSEAKLDDQGAAVDRTADADLNQRNVGVSVPAGPVAVPRTHPRNHDGEFFSVLVTRTSNRPQPGSDEIGRAEGDAWVGTAGYLRADGTRQRRAIAFLGDVLDARGRPLSEVFIVDLPDDLTRPGDAPLEGTSVRRPAPPAGVAQRRLTFTADRRHPGVAGPRHWVRSSPLGSRIAFLMRDQGGVVQLWTVSPNGGEPEQVTHNPFDVASAFSWHPQGTHIAYVGDGSVCLTTVASGGTRRLTPREPPESAPRPEACVFSPDGTRIAYVRPVFHGGRAYNQVFIVELA
ncbi:MAG: DUF3748 domain-containing protein [Planctomycetota bacterium]|nr:MAG: DUF3748 domain-containing protein [Planctomycetota bacterium]